MADEESGIAKFARLVTLGKDLDREVHVLLDERLEREADLSDSQKFFVVEAVLAQQLGRVMAARTYYRGEEAGEAFLEGLLKLARGFAADELARAAAANVK